MKFKPPKRLIIAPKADGFSFQADGDWTPVEAMEAINAAAGCVIKKIREMSDHKPSTIIKPRPGSKIHLVGVK